MALICDTGPLYASMDRADADHVVCADLLVGFGEPLLVPAPVIVELDWVVGTRLGPDPFLALLDDLADGPIAVVDLVRADYIRVRELLVRYAHLRVGFVDAAIIAVIALAFGALAVVHARGPGGPLIAAFPGPFE